MLETITAAISSLSLAKDMAKTAMSVRDKDKLSEAVRDLNSIILDAQSSAIDAKVEISSLIDKNHQIEKELIALKEFSLEKQRYELYKFSTGAVGYIIKGSERGSEPVHHLCQICFDGGKKSILQPSGLHMSCNLCKTEILIKQNRGRPPVKIIAI